MSPRTVLRTELFVRTARGTPIPPGTSGVSSTAWVKVGVWDTLNTVDLCNRVITVMVNITDEVQYSKKGEIVGYFSPIEEDILKNGLAGESTDEVFWHFSREPAEQKIYARNCVY